MITVSAYVPDGGPGPGRLAEVGLDVVAVGPAELVLPEATVRDERGLALFDEPEIDAVDRVNRVGNGLGERGGGLSLVASPAAGGGPLGGVERDGQARRFGLLNVAFHTQRALRFVAGLLGHSLPRLVVRVGMHDSPRRWGGGHYRVAARWFDPPEPGPVSAAGEVHLGGGSGFVAGEDGEPYFAAPSHNVAVIYHEVGHHVCRHTADFRLNRLRPQSGQTNKKIALDEGTCDVLAAILLGRPDIYGWHRGVIPGWDPRRRALDLGRTMAHFRGGRADPHADGNVWASACWTARERVAAAGHDRARFDRMLLRGLELSATHTTSQLSPSPTPELIRNPEPTEDPDEPRHEHLDQHADTHSNSRSGTRPERGPGPESNMGFDSGFDGTRAARVGPRFDSGSGPWSESWSGVNGDGGSNAAPRAGATSHPDSKPYPRSVRKRDTSLDTGSDREGSFLGFEPGSGGGVGAESGGGAGETAIAGDGDEIGDCGVGVGVLRRRRHVSGLLAAMVAVDPGLAVPVLAGMGVHGIWLGASNARLREAARASWVGGVEVGGG